MLNTVGKMKQDSSIVVAFFPNVCVQQPASVSFRTAEELELSVALNTAVEARDGHLRKTPPVLVTILAEVFEAAWVLAEVTDRLDKINACDAS